MSEQKHTSWPWKLLKFADDERYVVTNQDGHEGFYREIATVSFGYSEPAETEQHANARLIAAAPEMLEALLAITSNKHMNLGDLVYYVRERECQGWEGRSVKAWSDAVMKVTAAIAKATGR